MGCSWRRSCSTRSPPRTATFRKRQRSTRRGATCWPRKATTWAFANIPARRATGWRRSIASRTSIISHGARSATTTSMLPKSLSTRPNPPAFFDSGASKAKIDWLAQGPLWCTLRAQHAWRYLNFETRVTLAAGSPYLDVTSRILALVPPHSDASPPDIKEGYWFSFVPSFSVTKVLRDFPFGVEETKNPAFHAQTFVDLLGQDRGLLVLHAGTQYFQQEASGQVSNLVMREWESYFTHEYGWPTPESRTVSWRSSLNRGRFSTSTLSRRGAEPQNLRSGLQKISDFLTSFIR